MTPANTESADDRPEEVADLLGPAHKVTRQGRVYVLRQWPDRLASSPLVYRWAVYHDGKMVGAAPTRAAALKRLHAGWYDPHPPAQAPAIPSHEVGREIP